jgi:hypothetical protein
MRRNSATGVTKMLQQYEQEVMKKIMFKLVLTIRAQVLTTIIIF